MENYLVKLKDKKNISVKKGTLLCDAMEQMGVFATHPCGKEGRCKKCLCKILSFGKEETVLSCQYEITTDIEILSYYENEKKPILSFQNPNLLFSENSLWENVRKAAAIDIGSTNVNINLFDVENKCYILSSSCSNRQSAYGADVIARCKASMENTQDKRALKELVHETINASLEAMLKQAKIDKNEIDLLILCANSVMQHLFFGYDVTTLAKAPFKNIHTGKTVMQNDQVGLFANQEAKIIFLSPIESFVGSDTSSLLATINHDDKTHLIIDLGTNGEIALMKDGKFTVTSTACGPAFEGEGVTFGSPAIKGAIEEVKRMGNKLKITTVGEETPGSICASAIVDTISLLLDEGLLKPNGRLLGKESKCTSPLKEHLDFIENENCFVLNREPLIYLTQSDIRQIQLSKGAIAAGCAVLLGEENIDIDQLDEIVISGAFGYYLGIDEAIRMGLLPFAPREKFSVIGNGALTGCSLCIIEPETIEKVEKISHEARHTPLEKTSAFSTEYMKKMKFERWK